VVKEDNLIFARNEARPGGVKVVLRLNKYNPHRANLAVFNWERRASVEVDVSSLLKPGDKFRLLNPRDSFGQPVLTGRATEPFLNVPMDGEFAAFVVMRE
jgi:hypothetical protein